MLKLRDPLALHIGKGDVAIDGEDDKEDVGIAIGQGAQAIILFLNKHSFESLSSRRDRENKGGKK